MWEDPLRESCNMGPCDWTCFWKTTWTSENRSNKKLATRKAGTRECCNIDTKAKRAVADRMCKPMSQNRFGLGTCQFRQHEISLRTISRCWRCLPKNSSLLYDLFLEDWSCYLKFDNVVSDVLQRMGPYTRKWV